MFDQPPEPAGTVDRGGLHHEEPQLEGHRGEIGPPVGFDTPVGGRTNVIELGHQPRVCSWVAGVRELGGYPRHKLEEMAGVALAGGLSFAVFGEAIGTVLAKGLEEPVAALIGLIHHE